MSPRWGWTIPFGLNSVSERGRMERSEGNRWQLHNRPSFEGRLMGAQADTGPVRRLSGIGEWIAFFNSGAEKFVHQVRMRPAVARALGEAQMRFLRQIID